jgi:hypothetical protein
MRFWGKQQAAKILASCAIAVSFGFCAGQATADDSLAKKLANPIASLISIPVVLDYNSGYGAANGDQVKVELKPVIPFQINDDLAIVTRTIIPIIWQNDISGTSGTQTGFGDVSMSAWAVPNAMDTPLGELTWGLGGTLNFAISTDPLIGPGHYGHPFLGSGQWMLGPTFLFLFQQSGWTVGNLFTQQWGFEKRVYADPDEPLTDLTLLQPFLNYSHDGWTYEVNAESSYNWNTDEWSVPLNFTVAKLSKIGNQLVQYTLGARYWAVDETGGADGWGLRAEITFIIP